LLVQLRPPEPRVVPVDPAGLLLDCHGRIRHFARLARRLAAFPAAPAEVSEAAAAVHRYFTVALPLHVEDEERSVAPRLRGVIPEPVAAMAREHVAIERTLATLTPAWRALADDAARWRKLAAGLGAGARVLEELFSAHLAAEEELILPALGRLSIEEQQALVAEMRARR
jgi:hypothetical protein